jgi:hypothetical protein
VSLRRNPRSSTEPSPLANACPRRRRFRCGSPSIQLDPLDCRQCVAEDNRTAQSAAHHPPSSSPSPHPGKWPRLESPARCAVATNACKTLPNSVGLAVTPEQFCPDARGDVAESAREQIVHRRHRLRNLGSRPCPDVQTVGQAHTADSARRRRFRPPRPECGRIRPHNTNSARSRQARSPQLKSQGRRHLVCTVAVKPAPPKRSVIRPNDGPRHGVRHRGTLLHELQQGVRLPTAR